MLFDHENVTVAFKCYAKLTYVKKTSSKFVFHEVGYNEKIHCNLLYRMFENFRALGIEIMEQWILKYAKWVREGLIIQYNKNTCLQHGIENDFRQMLTIHSKKNR